MSIQLLILFGKVEDLPLARVWRIGSMAAGGRTSKKARSQLVSVCCSTAEGFLLHFVGTFCLRRWHSVHEITSR